VRGGEGGERRRRGEVTMTITKSSNVLQNVLLFCFNKIYKKRNG
jgi:hypothetical protein